MSTGATEIFKRVIDPESGSLPPVLARYLIELDFKADDHRRFETLSAKAQDGTLSKEEADELDGFLNIDALLSIMRLKAQRSLKVS